MIEHAAGARRKRRQAQTLSVAGPRLMASMALMATMALLATGQPAWSLASFERKLVPAAVNVSDHAGWSVAVIVNV